MKNTLLAALCAVMVLAVLAMPAAAADVDQAGQTVSDADVEQAGQTVNDVDQADLSTVTTVPPLTVEGAGQTIPPMAAQTIPPMAVQTIPPMAVQTIPPLSVQPYSPDLQVGISGSSTVYWLGPDGTIQAMSPDGGQSVYTLTGVTMPSQQYSGSLFSADGMSSGSYALTALCAFLGAAGGSALTWAIINRKKKDDKGDGKK